MEIDLGLPAAGDAVQQDGREPTESRGDALHCTCLVRNERMRWCEAGGGGDGLAVKRLARQRLERAQPRRQRRDDRLAKRPLVVGRKKAHQLEPLRGESRRIAAHIDHCFQTIEGERARAFFDHNAGLIASPERHGHAIA